MYELTTMSSSAIFQVKHGYSGYEAIHFELPCGARLSKQVLPEYERKFLNGNKHSFFKGLNLNEVIIFLRTDSDPELGTRSITCSNCACFLCYVVQVFFAQGPDARHEDHQS